MAAEGRPAWLLGAAQGGMAGGVTGVSALFAGAQIRGKPEKVTHVRCVSNQTVDRSHPRQQGVVCGLPKGQLVQQPTLSEAMTALAMLPRDAEVEAGYGNSVPENMEAMMKRGGGIKQWRRGSARRLMRWQ